MHRPCSYMKTQVQIGLVTAAALDAAAASKAADFVAFSPASQIVQRIARIQSVSEYSALGNVEAASRNVACALPPG